MEVIWSGNAAKTKALRAILAQACDDRPITIFDYGCGSGGEWPRILCQQPNIHLIGYDPSRSSIKKARAMLNGRNVLLLTGDQLNGQSFKADFITSFSVLEHVYDRRAYLQTAKDYLHDEGAFYLNYDDGHFRNTLDLNAPRLWRAQGSEWLHNMLAGPLARLGLPSFFQKRVYRTEIDGLITEMGFRQIDEFYSNVISLKHIYKLVPEDRQQEYMRLWVNLEDELNAKYMVRQATETMGDNVNLWPAMNSRTVVLRHLK